MSALQKLTIGCIGAGNMGSAITARLAERLPAESVLIFDTDAAKSAALAKHSPSTITNSAKETAERADIIILAVKPDVVPAVLKDIRGSLTEDKIIVSIAAGVSISSIEKNIGNQHRVVRVMPNTPALVGEGIAVLSPGQMCGPDVLAPVEEIFSLTGKTIILPERYLDAVTGLSGSGPAYVFTFIQALADGGVKMGIPRETSLTLAAQTVLGAARYLIESGENPITLRDRVASPGGTTIDAVHLLERGGFSGLVIDAVEAAALKSKKLGEK